MGWHMDPSDVLNEDPMEFMRQLESIGWNGGENFFDGKCSGRLFSRILVINYDRQTR